MFANQTARMKLPKRVFALAFIGGVVAIVLLLASLAWMERRDRFSREEMQLVSMIEFESSRSFLDNERLDSEEFALLAERLNVLFRPDLIAVVDRLDKIIAHTEVGKIGKPFDPATLQIRTVGKVGCWKRLDADGRLTLEYHVPLGSVESDKGNCLLYTSPSPRDS